MMKCVDRFELEQFLQGALPPERLVAIDEHVCSCPECRALLERVPRYARAGLELGDALLGITDCPEYEELSALVDRTLGDERAKLIRAHVNACDLCARDVARLSELRSHAALRSKVTARPGMSRQTRRSGFFYWKRGLAGVSAAAAAAALAIFAFGHFATAPEAPTQMAERPEVTSPASPDSPAGPGVGSTSPTPGDKGTLAAAANDEKAGDESAVNEAKPRPARRVLATVLRDGVYKIVEDRGRLQLVRRDGRSVESVLGPRVAAALNQKLNEGVIQQTEAMVVARNTIATRGDGSYVPPPTAPEQIAPIGKILLTATPTFKWSKVDMAEAYHVIITDKDGNRVLDEVVKGTTFTPSAPLERGEIYAWRAGARFTEGDVWSHSGAARFKVISSDDYASIQKIRAELPGSHLALGVAYETFGLYEEAANEYRALKRQNPDSELADKILLKPDEAGR